MAESAGYSDYHNDFIVVLSDANNKSHVICIDNDPEISCFSTSLQFVLFAFTLKTVKELTLKMFFLIRY